MSSQKKRLLVLLALGLCAALVARPLMTQIMLMQENQRARVIKPPPDYVPPMDIQFGGMGSSESGSQQPSQASEGAVADNQD